MHVLEVGRESLNECLLKPTTSQQVFSQRDLNDLTMQARDRSFDSTALAVFGRPCFIRNTPH